MYTVTNNKLTIAMDVDFITGQIQALHELILSNSDEFQGSKLSREEMFIELDNIVKAMHLIMSLGDKIFEIVPLTKAGLFSKSASTLIYDTGLKSIFNGGDYVSQDKIQLRLKAGELNHSSDIYLPNIKVKPVYVSRDNFNGTYGMIVLTFKSGFNKEEPIITKDGKIQKVEKKRNSYIKRAELKYGNIYKDAKGTNYLLLFGEINYGKYSFYLLKVTKKVEKLLSNCTTISQLIQIYFHNESCWYTKCTDKPKFVSEVGKALEFDLVDEMYLSGELLTYSLLTPEKLKLVKG